MREYIHGSSRTERDRLALMNRLINPGCIEALGLTNEQRVLEGARTQVLASGEMVASEFDSALQRFRAFGQAPGSALWYVINYAEGVVNQPVLTVR